MLIEKGGYYRTLGGRRAGPLNISASGAWPFIADVEGIGPACFNADGKCLNFLGNDLVAPWPTEILHDHGDVNLPTARSIYLSGPMKGYPASNYPLFNAVADQLRRAGHRVYNPAEFKHPFDFFPIRQAFAAYSKFICEEADAIVLLPGWEASKGANAERALADNCGIEIIPFDRLSTTINTEDTH